MELIDLKASARSATGNGPARRLRQEGKIPAILYGPGTEPVLLSVVTADLDLILKKGKASQMLIGLTLENSDSPKRTVMIKELQRHPLTHTYFHADFYEIDMNRKIRVKVPVAVTGKSIGVEDGGILQVIRRELEVLCFPNQIPNQIEIDVTNLKMGDAVHVKDILLSEEIEIPSDVNYTVITVLSPKSKDAAAEGGDAGAAEGEGGETAAAGGA